MGCLGCSVGWTSAFSSGHGFGGPGVGLLARRGVCFFPFRQPLPQLILPLSSQINSINKKKLRQLLQYFYQSLFL